MYKPTGRYEALAMFPGDSGEPRWLVVDPTGTVVAITCSGSDEANAKKIVEALNRT